MTISAKLSRIRSCIVTLSTMSPPDASLPVPPFWSRRAILKIALIGVAGVAVGAGSAAALTRLGGRPKPYRSLSAAEADLLIGICEQLIPADDTPGATDAGVVRYIDRQLAGVFVSHRSTYCDGLAAFADACGKLHGDSFGTLSDDRKVAFLQSVEAGGVTAPGWPPAAQREFFELVLAHTLQGYFGSPRHGGNRGYASYRMLGLDYPQILGRRLPGDA